MSAQKQVLSDLAARLSAGVAVGLEDYFTNDFCLRDPSVPD